MNRKAVPVVALCLFASSPGAAASPPSETEAAKSVERTRLVAKEYTRQIPDFLCTQTIHRFRRLTLPKTWQPTDVLGVKVRYQGQTEDRRLVERNGEPLDQPEEGIDGLENIGEFGGMLETIFDPATQAVFQWESWKTVRGRPAAVYSYRVDREHSAYMLTFTAGGFPHRLVVAYRGTVEVDRETGAVLHLVYQADDVPKEFPMQFASTSVDYDFVEVAGRRHLLPVRSEVETGSDLLRMRNISEFTAYQKFTANSSVQFGALVEK